MTTIDRVGQSPAPIESRPVQQDQNKERPEKVAVQEASSEDAVVADVRSRGEITSEEQAFDVVANLASNIKKRGLDSVNAQQTRPSEDYRELLR